MLRILNFSRNVGANILRSSVREDRPKSSPSNRQFLFWLSEDPYAGCGPAPATSALCLPDLSSAAAARELGHYAEFSSDREDRRRGFGDTSSSSAACLRAAQWSALLAVSYSILHDKLLAKYFRDTFRPPASVSLNLGDLLEASCPVLAVKHHKSVHAQPLDPDTSSYNNFLTADTLGDINKQDVNDTQLSTSDYSSAKSEDETCSLKFTKEEEAIMRIETLIPVNVNDIINSVRKIRSGDKDGLHQLTKMSEEGCSMAQFYLGQVYEHGVMRKRNLSLARDLYTRACEGGHAEAKFSLGLMYLRGDVEAGDSGDLGGRLVREAAEEGVSEARDMLGLEPVLASASPAAAVLGTEEVEEMFRRGLQLELHPLCEEGDRWLALDCYQAAARSGHQEAARRHASLVEAIRK